MGMPDQVTTSVPLGFTVTLATLSLLTLTDIVVEFGLIRVFPVCSEFTVVSSSTSAVKDGSLSSVLLPRKGEGGGPSSC